MDDSSRCVHLHIHERNLQHLKARDDEVVLGAGKRIRTCSVDHISAASHHHHHRSFQQSKALNEMQACAMRYQSAIDATFWLSQVFLSNSYIHSTVH